MTLLSSPGLFIIQNYDNATFEHILMELCTADY